MLREFDTDNDGEIDFKEFKTMVDHLQKGTFDDYDSDEEKEAFQIRLNEKVNGNKLSDDKKITPEITRTDLEKALGAKLNGTL